MTIYSKTNHPTGFYTYFFVRKDSTPYYVGKGIGDRAWKSHKRSNGIDLLPREPDRIVIVEANLSEQEALLKEIELISKYGRKDLNTGILRNLTAGGEGCSGRIKTEFTKMKTRTTKLIRGTSSNDPAIIAKAEATKSKRSNGFASASFIEKAKETRRLTGALQNSPAIIAKQQLTQQINKTGIYEIMSCQHCGKTMGKPHIIRWHGDNCKLQSSHDSALTKVVR